MARDEAVLLDIARAARLAIAFYHDTGEQGFDKDLKSQSAVLHQLMVIGEAVKRLSAEFRAQHAHVPWSLMAGMRDKLIHGYDIVDLEEVQKTVAVDLPQLMALLEPLLPNQPETST